MAGRNIRYVWRKARKIRFAEIDGEGQDRMEHLMIEIFLYWNGITAEKVIGKK